MKKILLLILLLLVGCTKDSNITNINTEELSNYLSNEYTLLDVRTTEEYNDNHIPGFINIDYYEFSVNKSMLNSLDKNKPIVLICRSGNRSSESAKILSELGFTDIYNVTGGISSYNG